MFAGVELAFGELTASARAVGPEVGGNEELAGGCRDPA
jgi:hypothetical protein